MIFFASHSFWCSYSAGIVDDARRSRGERTCYAAIFCLGCHASCCKTYRSPQYLESWILHVCLSLSFSLPPLLSPPSLRLCVCDCQSVSVSACWSVFRPHLCVCVCLSRIRQSLSPNPLARDMTVKTTATRPASVPVLFVLLCLSLGLKHQLTNLSYLYYYAFLWA